MDDGQADTTAAPAGIAWLRRDGLVALALRNAALLVCTAGLYRFWGKAAWRRHVWSRIALRGDPLEFVGTGLEGFKGFLIGLAICAPVFAAIDLAGRLAAGGGLVALVLAKLAYAAAVLALLGAGRFLRLRYLLSRTRWRGVSPALDARFADYVRAIAPLQALNALALFALSPWVWHRRQAWLIARLRFGATPLAGVPGWRPLAGPWLGVWASATIGLLAAASWVLDAAHRSGKAPPSLPVPPVAAPGWLAPLALAAAVAFFAAYRMAAWRECARAIGLGDARLTSAARPGFAAGRAALAALVFAGALAVGLLCAGALLLPVPRGATNVLIAAWTGLGVAAAAAALALARDAFFRPSAIAHFVSTLDLAGGAALDALAAGAAPASRWEALDAGAG
jgi:hypothetical protein